jgi:hypothetical protein
MTRRGAFIAPLGGGAPDEQEERGWGRLGVSPGGPMGPKGGVGAPASEPWRAGTTGHTSAALLGKTLPFSGKTFPFLFHGTFL